MTLPGACAFLAREDAFAGMTIDQERFDALDEIRCVRPQSKLGSAAHFAVG